ncbi:MAG: 4-(cytidine 5'-diphospho)-2-C-methyl-D-erythritol kinase [Anaeromyxobacter sp. RBG_16_69_14]|nr:MAG: 4-(cytidine 5'-diphospho)-2-C-methyl-D-erythritol kinase [Anaeromyxobacter sp. RBG_16_69_14]
MRARAPAKVNLVLRVGPLRPDGYHDLETLMVPLDLADEIRVHLVRGRRGPVVCHAPNRPELDGPANLAARAAEAFRSRFDVVDGLDLVVEKRIPVTAGLGGGSSDAAAVLRALAHAYGVRDSRALAAAALEVGSDVPFFLGRGPAWATGRGEVLTPVRVPTLDVVLAYPRDAALAIRAGDAYRWLDAARQESSGTAGLPLPSRGRWRESMARNDLQGPCFERHPFLRTVAGQLVGLGATTAIMSGSGPTVFGIFPDRAAAGHAAVGAREAGFGIEVHVVRTLQRHPGVSRWKSPRFESSPSAKKSSRRT